MLNKNTAERPNRVVTCQVCGVQMPQRYLAGHMKSHDSELPPTLPVPPELEMPAAQKDVPAEQDLPVPDPEPAAEVVGGKEPSNMLICPACADFVGEEEFTRHMQANHTNWCPLCHAQTKDLAEHLRSRHLLKPIQPPPPYKRSWDTQKRFICLGCKKKVSVWSYPKHEGPHGATRGLIQQIEKRRKSRP